MFQVKNALNLISTMAVPQNMLGDAPQSFPVGWGVGYPPSYYLDTFGFQSGAVPLLNILASLICIL